MVAISAPEVDGLDRSRNDVEVRTVSPIWIVDGGAVLARSVSGDPARLGRGLDAIPVVAVGRGRTRNDRSRGLRRKGGQDAAGEAGRQSGCLRRWWFERCHQPGYLPIGTVAVGVGDCRGPAILTKNSPAAQPVDIGNLQLIPGVAVGAHRSRQHGAGRARRQCAAAIRPRATGSIGS